MSGIRSALVPLVFTTRSLRVQELVAATRFLRHRPDVTRATKHATNHREHHP